MLFKVVYNVSNAVTTTKNISPVIENVNTDGYKFRFVFQ